MIQDFKKSAFIKICLSQHNFYFHFRYYQLLHSETISES